MMDTQTGGENTEIENHQLKTFGTWIKADKKGY